MELITLPVGRSAGVVYRLWVSATGRQLLALTGHRDGADRLHLWSVHRRRVVGRLNAVTDTGHGIAWPEPTVTPDFRLLSVGLEVRRRADRHRVTLDGPANFYDRLALTPDGAWAFAAPNSVPAGETWPVERWELGGALDGPADWAAVPARLYLPDGDRPTALAVSPDGRLLAVGGELGVYRFRLPAADPLGRLDLPGGLVRQLVFAPAGDALAVVADRLLVCGPDAAPPVASGPAPDDVAFTPDGRLVVVARGVVSVRDPADGRRLARYSFRRTVGPGRAVAVAPDGLTAFAGGTRGRVVRWDL